MPTRVVLAVALLFALGFVWFTGGRERWRSLVGDRLHYGVPWGTLVTVAVVVAFYLFVQGGFRDWSEPLLYPFVSWSYFYPTGILTAGIAHGSPNHLFSNMTATLALAPIAEYAWSHYPPRRSWATGDQYVPATTDDHPTSGIGIVDHPWVRSLVLFPAALLGSALLTSIFSLGPGLGFSGAVFAIAGFAVVTYPLTTVVGVVVTSAIGTLLTAFTQPIVRATLESRPPSPPAWAGIGFQAHALGFLLGVLAAIALLRSRERRPSTDRVFVGVLLLALVQSLWLIVGSPAEDVWVLYRGAGVTLVLLLTVLISVAVAGRDRPLPGPLSTAVLSPPRARIATAWAVLVGIVFLVGLAGTAIEGESVADVLPPLLAATALLMLPALATLFPERWFEGPRTRRRAAVLGVVVVTVLVAAPSVFVSLVVVGGDTVPGSGGVETGDYTVTYEENATTGQTLAFDLVDDEFFQTQVDGVIVVSDQREIWTIGVPEFVLQHRGEGTVHVGGPSWRETVHADRTGWDVAGNDSAYVVDLEHDGDRTRSFVSDPVASSHRISDRTVAVVPTDDEFAVRVSENGTSLGQTQLPDAGETVEVGDLRIEATRDGNVTRLFAVDDGTRVQVAERESN